MEKRTLIVLCLCVAACYGSKILLVFPVPANSHNNLGNGFLRHLVKAGHEVTYITPYQATQPEPNVRRIIVNTFNAYNENFLNIASLMKGEAIMDSYGIFHMMYNVSNVMLNHDEVKKLMNDPEEKFDLVIAEIMFNGIYSGFSAVFQCPLIWSVSYEPNFEIFSLIDEATNPAYTNNVAFSLIPPFTFIERVKMLYYQIAATITIRFNYRNYEKQLYEKVFSPVMAKKGRVLPPYDDIRLNASLLLGNAHVSYGTSQRLPQNLKYIGGYHIDSTNVKPLPADLKKIMDTSKNGVIYFSMGSNLKSKDFPVAIGKSLLEMFGKLKQTVIWKFEATFPNVPENVHVLKWAPQQSILAHPNCVLFITHGGLLSTTEAIHFGVPVIGIPVYFDQFNNIDKAEARGFGKRVDLSHNLTHNLKNAIDEIINNPQYKQKLKEISFIYHHRPVPPGQELVHWVEHVIATGGAVHLRSPALHVPFYQKLYLDLLAVITLTIWAVKKFIIFLIVTRKRSTDSKKKRN